jgi:hypothetical protein
MYCAAQLAVGEEGLGHDSSARTKILQPMLIGLSNQVKGFDQTFKSNTQPARVAQSVERVALMHKKTSRSRVRAPPRAQFPTVQLV